MATETPLGALMIRVELPSSLSALADSSSALHRQACEAIARGIGELSATLGLPVRPVIEIDVRELAPRVLLRMTVDGARVRYATELLQRVYSYVAEQPLDPLATPEFIGEWMAERLSGADGSGPSLAIEFLSLACVEILKREPAVLLGLEQASAYASGLRLPEDGVAITATGSTHDPASLKDVLSQVLNLGISIGNRPAVRRVLSSAQPGPRGSASLVEDLIAALKPDVVEIRAPRPFLRELTMSGSTEAPGVFPFLREGLFEELGIELPRFRFVADDALKPRTFAFKVNHLLSLPLRGLEPDQLLVNDTAERLALMDLKGVGTANPATNQPGSMIHAREQAQAQAMGLTTWNQIQHVILCLADHLRQTGHRLMHRAWVHDRLERVAWVRPALVATVRAFWSEDDLTSLLRELARDGVSVRNWQAILDRIAEWHAIRERRPEFPTRWRDQALAHAVAFVRIGLGREIAYKASRQTSTIVVYLLDPAIERAVTDPVRSDDIDDSILEACHKEFAYLPPTAMRPHILTALETRRAVQELLRTEFPRQWVLAHEELPPGTNVQPVARINTN